MFNKKLIYLASPYSCIDPNEKHPERVREKRYREVSRQAYELVRQGYHILGPISQSHSYQQFVEGDHKTKWRDWREHDLNMLSRCDEVWIADMDGWQESTGVRAEILAAFELEKPIYFLIAYSNKLRLKLAHVKPFYSVELLDGFPASKKNIYAYLEPTKKELKELELVKKEIRKMRKDEKNSNKFNSKSSVSK